jgi:galacturan 1,4-alpha-galacturonidase
MLQGPTANVCRVTLPYVKPAIQSIISPLFFRPIFPKMSFLAVSLFFLLNFTEAFPSIIQRDPSPVLVSRAACTPTAGGTSSTDDVPAITAAIQSCGDGGTIVIPSGTTYYLNSVLDFTGCTNCDFQIEGILHFASSTSYWEGRTAMISVSSITGAKIRSVTGSGVIDGNGQDA